MAPVLNEQNVCLCQDPRCQTCNRARDLYLRRIYDITLAEYWAIFDYQEGLCAVCKKPPKNGVLLSVDHDHVENFVRGLLHAWCNHKIVGRHRDPGLLYAAADYLYHPPAVVVLGSGRKCPKKNRNQKRRRRMVK